MLRGASIKSEALGGSLGVAVCGWRELTLRQSHRPRISGALRAMLSIVVTAGFSVTSVVVSAGSGTAEPIKQVVVVGNGTGETLIGEWHAQWGSSVTGIDLGEGLQSGGERSSTVDYDPFHELYTWGRVCYQHSWWNLLRHRYTAKDYEVYSFTVRPREQRLEALGKSDKGEDSFPMVETEHGTAC